MLRADLNTALTCGIPAEIMAPYFRAMKEDLAIGRNPTFADSVALHGRQRPRRSAAP